MTVYTANNKRNFQIYKTKCTKPSFPDVQGLTGSQREQVTKKLSILHLCIDCLCLFTSRKYNVWAHFASTETLIACVLILFLNDMIVECLNS